MGAWNHDIFANDSALDWLAAAPRQGVHAAVEDALHSAKVSYVDVDAGSSAVAAAAVVAAALDGNSEGLPEEARELAQDWNPDAKLVSLAVEALDAVLGAKSELASLWRDSSEGGAWRASIEAVRGRLNERRT